MKLVVTLQNEHQIRLECSCGTITTIVNPQGYSYYCDGCSTVYNWPEFIKIEEAPLTVEKK